MTRSCIALAVLFMVTAFFYLPNVFGADLANGGKVFAAYCAGCHKNGGNTVAADDTLKSADLKKNGFDSREAVKKQVINGRGKMPAFGSFLSAGDVEDVAAYVLDQAGRGW
jgi:cytochrome c6